MKNYQCICGAIFDNAQKFNGHKSHCKIHQQNKYGTLNNYNIRMQQCITARRIGYNNYASIIKNEKQNIQKNIKEKWLNEKHKCKTCGKVMTEYYGSGIYCSRRCANTRVLTDNTKQKISCSNTNKKYVSKQRKQYQENPKKCCICGSNILYEYRKRKTCSDKCLHQLQIEEGKKVVLTFYKRSKNEIAFCNKCEDYFGSKNVLHNEPMFNGWDADIILPQYKLAILWNGPWHYRQVIKTHKLKQVQNRDKIKIKEIKKANYVPYIIKDIKQHDKNIVDIEFKNLLKYLKLSE